MSDFMEEEEYTHKGGAKYSFGRPSYQKEHTV
jgi:hypothetical protein